MIKKLLNNATAKNASWIIAGKVIQMIISLLVGILTTRYLGPANHGLINYGTAYVAFFMSVCNLGINSILVKEFVDNIDDEGKIIGSTLAMRAITSLLSIGIIACLVSIVDYDSTITIVVAILCSLSLIFNIFETFNYWFQSKLKSKVTAMITLVAYIVTSIYKIILLILDKDVQWFAFATSIDYLCIGILLFIFYKRAGGQKLSFSWATCKRLLSKSVYFILPGLMVAIYGYADKFMLKHMLSESEVGYYSTATTVAGMWVFILSAIIDSMNPSIMEAHKIDKALYEKRNRQLYAIVFYLSIIVSILFTIFSELVIYILYGEEFMPSAMPLRIITWYTAFSYLGVARNAWIVCEDKGKYLIYIYLCAAVSNVLLNLALIPLWGASGAALASLITQIITVFVVPFFIKDLKRNSILMLQAICFKDLK